MGRIRLSGVMATDRRVLFHTRAHCVGMTLALACAALAGCASMHTHDVKPDAPKLPPAAIERLPQTAAVYFSDAFRTARPEHTVNFLGDAQTWRHALGDASVETFRQALAAVYTRVVELAVAPDAAMPPGVSVVVVPQPPTVHAHLDENAVVTIYRQSVEYPVTLLESGAVAPTQTRFEGSVATGAHGVGFMSQKTLDEGMMRSASAALIVALLQESPVDASAPSSKMEAAAPPNASGVGVLRLDAGLAHDDGMERRVGACLSRAVAAPATLAGEQPGAALRDALFPWLDPGVAPSDADGIRTLLERPAVRARLAALGVGKIVLFTARDVEPREKRNMYCAAGFNAGACFGLYESRTGYAIDISVWDVDRRELLGTDGTEVTHTLGAIGLLVPIPFFSSNETEACEQMRQYVHRVLRQ
jgi:hypothetical protein